MRLHEQGCSYETDFAYKVVPSITLKIIAHATPVACCNACRALSNCAVFVLDKDKTCSVLSANQGGGAEMGAVSGTAKH